MSRVCWRSGWATLGRSSVAPPDPKFDAIKDIGEVYLSASERIAVGERTVCLDEMTGIQALERQAPDLPMRRAQD